MKDPHNYRTVGYSMILVSASLAMIGILGLFISDNVLFGDSTSRMKTMEFEACVETNHEADNCQKFVNNALFTECINNYDLESSECRKFTMWIQSNIFEECRANRDVVSERCQQYKDVIIEVTGMTEEQMMEEVEMMEEVVEEPEVMEEVIEETVIMEGPKIINVSIPSGNSAQGCELLVDVCYNPSSVIVNVGDTIMWSNDDTVPHTVSSGSFDNGPDGAFDSGLLMQSSTFKMTFDESGSFDYYCFVHPWMVGNVQVN